MKNLVFVFVALVIVFVAIPTFASTNGAVEVYFQPEKGSAHPGLDLYLAHRFDRWGLGVSAFALVVEGWAQVYAGPTWAPVDWLEIGLAIGGEQTPDGIGLRFEASIWVGYKEFSFLGIVEFLPRSFEGDDSGVWYDLTPKYQPLSWLGVGAKWRRFVGLGPLVEFVLPTSPSGAVWLNWAPVEPEGLAGLTDWDRFLVGAKGSF